MRWLALLICLIELTSFASIEGDILLFAQRSHFTNKVTMMDLAVAGHSIAGGYESPEKVHADRELQTLVREAVSRLGKTAGEIFVLRYYEGFDNKDIATIMKTSPLVVGVVLHRARTKLRKEIGHYLEKHHEE